MTPITVTGVSTAVVADAPLTARPDTATYRKHGRSGARRSPSRYLHRRQHRCASRPTSRASSTGATAVPNSVASFSAGGGGLFDVDGIHTYAKPGTYTVTTVVFDEGGSTVTLTARPRSPIWPSPAPPRALPPSRARTPGRSCSPPLTTRTPWPPSPTSTPRSPSAAGATAPRQSPVSA